MPKAMAQMLLSFAIFFCLSYVVCKIYYFVNDLKMHAYKPHCSTTNKSVARSLGRMFTAGGHWRGLDGFHLVRDLQTKLDCITARICWRAAGAIDAPSVRYNPIQRRERSVGILEGRRVRAEHIEAFVYAISLSVELWAAAPLPRFFHTNQRRQTQLGGCIKVGYLELSTGTPAGSSPERAAASWVWLFVAWSNKAESSDCRPVDSSSPTEGSWLIRPIGFCSCGECRPNT